MAEESVLVRISIIPAMMRLTVSRPTEFVKKPDYLEDDEDEESNVGKLPPVEDSD